MESEQLRSEWEQELEVRYQILLSSNGAKNAFVQSFKANLDQFKLGKGLHSLLGEPNADRICLSCQDGYYLDVDGKCKLGDNLDFCEVFSGKSTCLFCKPGYWTVKKTDTLVQCVKADIFLRVRNCQYNGTYLQNQRPKCSVCERGYVLASNGYECIIDTVNSSRVNLGQGVAGCAARYGAFSIGIKDYDSSQQICRYTWLLPPFSLHLALSILVVICLVLLIYFTINPVKKGSR